jgi:HTH-type transcriptional regulator/antitoxin HigA
MKIRSVEATKIPKSLEPFLAIRTEREYDVAVTRLNALVDELGDNSKDPRYRLIETLSVLIEAYDRERHSLPDASGVEVMRFLMEEHGLTQKDLPEIGSQGVVSEVLAGRRRLNVRQIQALAACFGVQPGAFLDTTNYMSHKHHGRASAGKKKLGKGSLVGKATLVRAIRAVERQDRNRSRFQRASRGTRGGLRDEIE